MLYTSTQKCGLSFFVFVKDINTKWCNEILYGIGSCDTGDWSSLMAAENSALPSQEWIIFKINIKIENSYSEL